MASERSAFLRYEFWTFFQQPLPCEAKKNGHPFLEMMAIEIFRYDNFQASWMVACDSIIRLWAKSQSDWFVF